MLFSTIRCVFWGVLLILALFLIRGSTLLHKRRWNIASAVVIVLLWTLSAVIPIENAFITFPSAESAFEYIYTGNIKLVISGNETDFIIAENDKNYNPIVFPKTKEGWKLGMFSNMEEKREVFDGITVSWHRYKNSQEYYIVVSNSSPFDAKPIELSDNHNSEFYCLERRSNIAEDHHVEYLYYAYIGAMDQQYLLTANGYTYTFSQ